MEKRKWLKRAVATVLTVAMCFGLTPIGNLLGIFEAQAEDTYTWKSTSYITNGDLNTYVEEENGWWNCAHEWSFSMEDWSDSTCGGSWVSDDHDGALKLINGTSSENSITMQRTVSEVPAGTYRLTFEQNAATEESGLSIKVLYDDDEEITTLSMPETDNTSDWSSVTTDVFTLNNTSDIKIQIVGSVPADYWGNFDNFVLEEKTLVVDDNGTTNLITNGDFEDGLNGWTASETPKTHTTKTAEGDAAPIYGKIYDFWSENGVAYSVTQDVELTAGSYKLTAEAMGADGIKVYVYFDGRVSTDCVSDPGWNVWKTVGENSVFTLDEDQEVTVGFYIVCGAGGWGDVDNVTLVKIEDADETETQNVGDVSTGEEEEEIDTSTAIEAGIQVNKVSGLADDFITGVDVSSYVSEKNSGVKYYDFDGNELNDQEFFNFLAECGVNYIRIRVWNNPYDSNGNGYGGGNNDLETAKKIGQWASNAGMKVLIDFHYSDFWTDPSKQYVPKAWEGLDVDEKADALYTYTYDSLTYLIDNGVNVGMVQVGNETNARFCGETDWTNICKLFSAGSRGVRAVADEKEKDILVALHFADPQNGVYGTYAKYLDDNGVDYDVFASSYYPFFHGEVSNLTSVLTSIASTYNKKVMVAETSWATTLEDGDGHDNQIRKGTNDTEYYEFSVLGQATEVRTVINAVKAVDIQTGVDGTGIGVFYWEPAWIPVQVYDKDAADAAQVLAQNRLLWETYGSGWASSYGGEYQIDAADWYGGSAMDNQAMFDFTGHPLESLKVFRYVRTGTYVTNVSVSSIKTDDVYINENDLDKLECPTALVRYTDLTEDKDVPVDWNETELATAKKLGAGDYVIHGTLTDSLGKVQTTSFELHILAWNYLLNGDFESANTTEDGKDIWVIPESAVGLGILADGNGRTKDTALKFWSDAGTYGYTAYQTVTLDKGEYFLGAYLQGGDAGEDAKFQLYITVNGNTLTADAALSGWKNWANPQISNIVIPEDGTTVTVGVIGENIASGGWGAWDDFYLNKYGSLQLTESVISEGAPVTKLVDSLDVLKELVFTEEELKKIAGGKNAQIYLIVDDIGKSVTENEKTLIANAAKGYTVGMYLDLNLFKQIGNEDAIKVTELGGKINISIVIPETLRNTDSNVTRTFNIVRIHDNTAELLGGEYDEETHEFTFMTDRFSTYAIVYKDVNNSSEITPPETDDTTVEQTSIPTTTTASPKTGDDLPVIPVVLVMVAAFGMMAVVVFLRRRRTR